MIDALSTADVVLASIAISMLLAAFGAVLTSLSVVAALGMGSLPAGGSIGYARRGVIADDLLDLQSRRRRDPLCEVVALVGRDSDALGVFWGVTGADDRADRWLDGDGGPRARLSVADFGADDELTGKEFPRSSGDVREVVAKRLPLFRRERHFFRVATERRIAIH